MSDNAQTPNEQNVPVFDIIRMYARDCSLETPNVPQIFQVEWKPEVKVDFDSKARPLGNDTFEVTLRVTVTCTVEKQTAYICEVNQAGIFIAKNINQDGLEFLLNGAAPNILFPYAREHISTLIGRATFPQLNLRPMNFEMMFQAQKAQQAQQEAAMQDVANGAAKDETPQA